MRLLSGQARLAGIIGWPVSHSRSPRLHGLWLERYGIDGAYVPLPVHPERFQAAIHGLVAAGFAGANVTIPHKVAAFGVCNTVEESARRAGAVNTLVFSGGDISGSNTDGSGFIANLQAHGVELRGAALVLGAGGSARAIVAALQDAGLRVTIANRTAARAEALAIDLPGLTVLPWSERDAAVADHGLVVNTTSLGMTGAEPIVLDFQRAAPGTVVTDLVYVPLETPLLAAARAHGLQVVDGLGLLLHQAVPGFTAWFGVVPTVDDELRDVVAADLLGTG